MTFQISRLQKRIIFAVSFGNILEWFEIYLYAYWAEVLSKVFFGFNSDLSNSIGFFVVFGAGFLARPAGSIIFGRLGDLFGRKKSFLLSIILLTIPTFLIGMLPTYEQIGLASPLLLTFLRLLQSIPASGETPGAFCYLYENANPTNIKFMTSWGAVGNQIGALLCIIEFFFMNRFLSESFLIDWGWRISFFTGGTLGLLGLYLRSKLQETPEFRELQKYHKIHPGNYWNIIKIHQKAIWVGVAYSALNATTFYLLASYIPNYFNSAIGIGMGENILISSAILLLTTILLPVFGYFGDRFSNKPFLVISAILSVLLLIPFYISVLQDNLSLMLITGLIYLLPIACMTALLVYQTAHLFPSTVRYTGLGLAFNLSDGIIGGFTPAIALILFSYTGDQAAFCWYIFLSAAVSLIAYLRIRR